MGAALLNASSQLMCPHGGQVSIITSNTKVKGGGDYLIRSSDTFTITGCPLNVAGAPHPCVQVKWMSTAMQSKTAGDANLTEQSLGMCLAADQAVQGTVMVSSTQRKVSGR
jgi:hypothetical protein